MPHTTTDHNPFMLMLHPEVVLAAVEKSERLSQLNRRLCRPLDRPVIPGGRAPEEAASEEDDAVEETGPVEAPAA